MRRRHRAAPRIHEEHRQAVRGLDAQDRVRPFRDGGVGLGPAFPRRFAHRASVHLLEQEQPPVRRQRLGQPRARSLASLRLDLRQPLLEPVHQADDGGQLGHGGHAQARHMARISQPGRATKNGSRC
jgi:hypothetical protein